MTNFDFSFDSLFNAGDLLKQIESKTSNVQAKGESGAGDIVATVNGSRELLKIEINPEIIKSENKDVLQDLIVAAVNTAVQNAMDEVRSNLFTSGVESFRDIDISSDNDNK